MDRESSDEEDDRENLIIQNDTRTKSPRRSAFHIDDFTNKVSGNLGFSINKRYLFAIFLPLFIIILYFTTDIKGFFQSSVSNFKSNASIVSESELRALYLLRQQQLGLVKLWNNTLSNSTLLNPSNTTSQFTEDLKFELHKQISLNNEIQKSLLSSHQFGDFKAFEENYTDLSLGFGLDLDRCRKTDQRFSERRTIEWKPKSDKYLLAICVSGQMSNHLICLEKHMFFAAVLNRILVIPSSKVDYEFNRVIDIEHINKCVGRKVVVTFKEFAESKKNHLSIDKILCYFSLPQPCFMDEDHVKKLKALGISMNKLETAWVEDVKKPTTRTIQDVITKFSSDSDVIAVGDVFFADVEKDWVMQPGGPIDHKCKTLIEPSRIIVLTAQRFVQTFLGESFTAIHFRRHGFLKFCNAKKPSCFYPIPQAAECINRVIERANTPVIYLSTDAAESETGLLQSLTVLNEKTVPLVKRPGRNSAEKWDALLYRQGIEDDPQVEAMLDKTICGMSKVFIGAPGSTFTEDIHRLRKGWGSASICDQYLCEGELPNFIAEDE